ncbi:AsmA family protein [Vibrio sp. S4M6]|uniref:AsmA family protein n=1 Tax=Vibrio sinus TaxID=2946865 RepID=UPI002029C7CF|nr:AsmA family protein [Vibrio sinus]MCL9782627.1 AsmA family protein [Vibrio sinus]
MKKLLLFISAIIILIVIGLTALVTLVNPNQFKPLIVEQVKKQTGLELIIQGDIHWQFFPSIGLEMGKTELKNPKGFSNPDMFKVDNVGVSVSVLPLIDKKLEIGNVTLNGAQVDIETLKDGRKNIDALLNKNQASDAATTTTEASKQSSGKTQPSASTTDEGKTATEKWTVNLAGVTIADANLQIRDQQTGSFTKLSNVDLTLSGFAPEQWTKVSFSAKGQNNQQTFSAQGSAEFKLSQDFSQYSLRDIALTSTLSAPDLNVEKLQLELNTFGYDEENNLSYALKGEASGLKFDLNGKGVLSVDYTLSTIALSGFTLDGQLQGKSLPQSPLKLAMTSALSFDLTKQHLSLVLQKLTANALELDGKADVTLANIPKVRFSLHSPDINLDEWMPAGTTQNQAGKPAQSNAKSPSSPQSPPATVSKEVEPDLSALKTLDVSGTISIDKFQMQNAKMQNVKANISVNRGIAKLNSFTSNLYGGSIKANGQLNAKSSPASYQVKAKVAGVKVQPLLKDVLNNDKIEGVGNINLDLHGKGLTPTGIKKGVAGTVDISFKDGAVNGINVAQLIRTSYAKIKGEPVEQSEGVQKTDFSSMQATIKLANGVASTNNLSAKSPLLRVHGEGSANYVNETADVLIRTSIVGSLKGQGGQSIDELKDVTIPVKITGSWSSPKYKVVLDNALKQKAKTELEKGIDKLNKKLGDKINNEKTKQAVDKLINNLFK